MKEKTLQQIMDSILYSRQSARLSHWDYAKIYVKFEKENEDLGVIEFFDKFDKYLKKEYKIR